MTTAKEAVVVFDGTIVDALREVNNMVQVLRHREDAERKLAGAKVVLQVAMRHLDEIIRRLGARASWRLVKHDLVLEASQHLFDELEPQVELLEAESLTNELTQAVGRVIMWLKVVMACWSPRVAGSAKKRASWVRAFMAGEDPHKLTDEQREVWNQLREDMGVSLPSDRNYDAGMADAGPRTTMSFVQAGEAEKAKEKIREALEKGELETAPLVPEARG